MKEKITEMKNEFTKITTWMQNLLTYNQKELSKDILEKVKKALVDGSKNQDFTFQTINKEIVVSFRFGELRISQEDKKFIINIDESTIKNIYAFKREIEILEKSELEKLNENESNPTEEEEQIAATLLEEQENVKIEAKAKHNATEAKKKNDEALNEISSFSEEAF